MNKFAGIVSIILIFMWCGKNLAEKNLFENSNKAGPNIDGKNDDHNLKACIQQHGISHNSIIYCLHISTSKEKKDGAGMPKAEKNDSCAKFSKKMKTFCMDSIEKYCFDKINK